MKKKLNIDNFLFLIPILFLLFIKVPHLSLPYFWDEAWSYFTAVHKMYESGPGLLPGALPLNIAKGHPLFFFFLHSTWMKTIGASVAAVHTLSLLISIGTLLATYFTVKKMANRQAALISVSLLCVQALFLAQATMVLPEMLITLLLILSFNFYHQRKYLLYAICASLMVLTKETTIVFVGGFLLFHFFQFLRPTRNWRIFILENIYLLAPLFIYAVFLILHKVEYGSYFYDKHLEHVQITKYEVLKKLRISWEFIFLRYGRFALLASFVVGLGIAVIKTKRIKNGDVLWLLLLQIVLFIAFSIFNFFTYRYMLCLIALFTILTGLVMQQAAIKNKIANWIVVMVILAIPMYHTITEKTNSDIDLGYAEAVKVHQQMAKYCERQNWQDKSVSASFNLIYYLRNPALGYLTGEKGFSNVSDLRIFRDSEIFLIDCTNYGKAEQIDSIKMENQLVKEYELKHAWGEIYTNLPTN